ncbi:MAG: cytochrome c-type biogenesis protein CcmH [Hyphomicrobium sp.]|jgi:cytochrome c-type biogenesis protein CcmH|nr:cytochrome c-type biogenesis protein CcmH [Hyphomicrobium sp.]
MGCFRRLLFVAAAALLLLPLPLVPAAVAVQPDEILSDAGMERRARAISAGLRCLVCQNQSIDDSDAPLAKDLRVLVRERLVAGDSDSEVLDYVVARYGDFVLLKPPMNTHTMLLWLAPLMLLAGVVVFIIRRLSNPSAVASTAVPLSDQEQAALDRILKERSGDGSSA